MAKLTRSSWIKIIFIILFCLVICASLLACNRGFSALVNYARGFAGHAYNGMNYAEQGDFGIPAEDVRSIEINWLAGELEIAVVDDEEAIPSDSAEPRSNDIARPTTPIVSGVEESNKALRDSTRMTWQLRNGVLQIGYGPETWGLSSCSNTGKHLVLTLPRSLAESLESIDLSAASGTYKIGAVTCDHLNIDLASGQVTGKGLTAKSLDLDVASGVIDLSGSFPQAIKLGLASGNVNLACTDSCPTLIDLDVASGNVTIGIPQGSGFTATVDKLSGAFNCNIPGLWESPDRNKLVCGDGANSMDVDMTSGSVTIREN